MATTDMDGLLRALLALHVAFVRPQLLGVGDTIDVTLPYEVGKRFETWLFVNRPDYLVYEPNTWGGEIDRDTDNPKRFVTLQGCRIIWPIERLAVPGGGSVPRPLPNRVATIGPSGVVEADGRVTRVKP